MQSDLFCETDFQVRRRTSRRSSFPLLLLTQIKHKDQTDEADRNESVFLAEADPRSRNRGSPQHRRRAHQNSKQKEKIGSSSEQSLNDRLGGLLLLFFSTTFFGSWPTLRVDAVQLKDYLLNEFDARLPNWKDFRDCSLTEANQEQVQDKLEKCRCLI